jgi:uncharacterized protein YmfQ (DUF2313 family)
MNIFTVNDKNAQADMLARKLPDGIIYNNKYIKGSVLRNWLIALGLEEIRTEEYFNYLSKELSLTSTSDLLEEFEFDFGINSNCFASLVAGGTNQERINSIVTMIASDGTSTESQFEYLGSLLGFNITVTSNHPTTPDQIEDRFKIFIEFDIPSNTNVFPYTFPITFGSTAVQSILQCWFAHLKPAHCIIVYI